MHGLLKDEYLFKMTQHLIGMHLSFADLEALKLSTGILLPNATNFGY